MPLIVDNTVATPYLIRPLEWGADVVVHSTTKYLGGHGTAIGGAIIDAGRFDYAADPERFPQFNEPDPSYHGLRYAPDLGVGSALGANLAFILKARVQLLRDLGPAAAPFNSFLLAQGLETLSLRMERHVANAQRVAEWLTGRDEVESVAYAGLPTSKWYALGREVRARWAPGRCSPSRSSVGWRPASGSSSRWSCTATWPTSATYGHWSSTRPRPPTASCREAEQLSTGVTPGLVRLAVGIENIDDILADLEAGFRAAKEA